jgi:cytochrome P450
MRCGCCPQVVPLVVELTQRVSDHIAAQPGGVVDVSDGARRITSDIMGQMLLGEDLGGTRWE